jgi:hypothetical protein
MALVINERVILRDAPGRIVKITKNGWYTVELDTGEQTKVRGRDKLRPEKTSAEVRVSIDVSAEARVCDPYAKSVGFTRSKAASYRRDQLVGFILAIATPLVPVTPMDMRLVVADGNSAHLRYQTLDPSDARICSSSTKELETLQATSVHFKKAWEYANHKDSARVRGLDRSKGHVIYLAVITLSDASHALLPDAAHSERDQAYVGLAKHGVMHRWAGYRYNHMRSANSIDKRTMLVDACMRLHCAAGGKVWLFTIQHNRDLPLRAEEKRMIHYFNTYGSHGMNAIT